MKFDKNCLEGSRNWVQLNSYAPEYGVHKPFLSELDATTKPTISPYRPRASAKIRIKIMPTNNLGVCALARTPASPTMPIAIPAAKELKPTVKPAPRWAKPWNAEYDPGVVNLPLM